MEITFETEETIVLRESSRVVIAPCPTCGRDTLMATPRTAGFLAGVSERQIFRFIESGSIHFIEDSSVLVCLISVRDLENQIEP